LGLAREDAPEKEKGEKGLAQRVAALEQLLKHFSREKNEIFITGANLHIVNGLGQTDCPVDSEGNPLPGCPNGLGNLIVGYNEPREEEFFGPNIRTGSHNAVVGTGHNFSRVGGLVVGNFNTISGDFAVVSGGNLNAASGFFATVSGGSLNTASGNWSSVSGGGALLEFGAGNTASGDLTTVCGGDSNNASGDTATVSGGNVNAASGQSSSVSGGSGITQETNVGWSAGSEGDEVVVGNFRSP
jgi:hypothetical protein